MAVDDVSLSVARGEIFGLLGPNGSGKTTLFRVLSTLVPLQAGDVRIMGMSLTTHKRDIRKKLGIVFQSPSLDRNLTAAENLRHHGHLYGLRGKSLEDRIDESLRRFSLFDRRDERVDRFSGGMRRRVELAKGILHRPGLLILDEPSTGLDPIARIELWRALDELRTTDGVTILLTTHLMDEADQCTRLAILHRGRIVANDPPDALKALVGGDVISILARDRDAVRVRIRERLSVEMNELDGALRIERPRGHELVPQLIEAAPGLIESISVGKPTLQDVFVRLTGTGFNEITEHEENPENQEPH